MAVPETNAEAADATAFREIALPLAGLLALAVFLRVFAWSRTAVLFNDGPVFLAIADAIGEGRWADVLTHPYHPLYPFCIHLVSKLGWTPETAAVAVSISGALLGIVALHVLLRRSFGRDVAWSGAWILTLHPWAVDFSADVMSDGLYLGFYLAAFAALASMVDRPNTMASVAFGIFTVLAFLVRPEALGLLGVGGLLLGFRMALDAGFLRSSLRPLAVLVFVLGIGLTPYVALLSLEAGELTLTQKKSVRALVQGQSGSARTRAKSVAIDSRPAEIWLPQSAAEVGAGQPPRDTGGAIEAMTRVLRTSSAALRYEILLFVVIGALILRRERGPPWRAWTLGLPVVLYSALLVLLVWGAGYVSRRHALAPLVPLFGVAAVAWQAMGRAFASRWKRWRVQTDRGQKAEADRCHGSGTSRGRVVCVGLVVVLAIAWGPRDLRDRRSDRWALREAAEWIDAGFPAPGLVAAEKLRTAYYAGAGYVPLRALAGESLERTLERGGARFVVIDGNRLDRYPGLREGIGIWLREIHSVRRDDQSALVFEVDDAPAR